jgi:hypothetical protein
VASYSSLLSSLFLFLFLSALPCSTSSAAEPPVDAERRLNFLFILVDDQSPADLQIYNPSSPLHAPNLATLARRGMVLDNVCHMGSFSGGCVHTVAAHDHERADALASANWPPQWLPVPATTRTEHDTGCLQSGWLRHHANL